MSDNKQIPGMIISTTQMSHAWDFIPAKHRAGINENKPTNDLAERVQSMGTLVKRTEVLAQILSPSGKLHLHSDPQDQLSCFPQSVCWKFPEKVE